MDLLSPDTLTYISDTIQYPVHELYARFSTDDPCPNWAPAFGNLGAALGLFFASKALYRATVLLWCLSLS